MSACAIESEAQWFLAELKDRVRLYGFALVETDSVVGHWKQLDHFEREILSRGLVFTFDPLNGNGRYAIWRRNDNPPRGWTRAKKEELTQKPKIKQASEDLL
jgi:hypothetical protein